jgi:hypothetical protein
MRTVIPHAIGLALTLFCGNAIAASLNWPSAACSGTLQACINAAAAGDEIQIVTQATIIEDLIINKSVRLFARGTAARFGVGNNITVNAFNNSDAITLENLWLTGTIRGSFGSGNTAHTQSITLNALRIETPAANGQSVLITRLLGATSSGTVTISRSTISSQAAALAAIEVGSSTSAGNVLVNVFNNQVTSVFDGIYISLGAGRTNILSNRIGRALQPSVTATPMFGILVEGRGDTSATPIVQIARNVSFNYAIGAKSIAITAPLDTRILNNTFARNTTRGIELQRATATPPTHIGRVANNLVTSASCGLSFGGSTPAVTATADYNFYQAPTSTCLGASAGLNDRTGNPQFFGGFDFRTRATSPNVDVGNNADQPAFLGPTPDFDSRNGRVNGTVDMGAHEFSIDTSFEHVSTAANTLGNISEINLPPFLLFASDVLQLGQFGRDIDTTPVLPSNLSAHLGLWFNPTASVNVWNVFNQNSAEALAAQRRFFVLVNENSNSNLLHESSAANTLFNVTTLDHPALNGQSTAIPIVTQRWDPDGDGDGTYNNSAIGIWYDTSVSPARWKVFNQAPSAGVAPNLAIGTAFNVMIPNLFALGAHAFRTDPLAVPVTVLNLDNPLLNNTACAHAYVTASYNPNNIYVPANLILSYNRASNGRGNWAIERGDGLPIPAGAAFHVYVDPQRSRRCVEEFLFNDGFE